MADVNMVHRLLFLDPCSLAVAPIVDVDAVNFVSLSSISHDFHVHNRLAEVMMQI